MKILHAVLSQGFYGSERYCVELASAQARAGHQVEVLIQDPGSDCARIFRNETVAASAAIAEQHGAGRLRLTIMPAWLPAWLHRPFARRALGRFRPDIVHSHLNPAGRRVGGVAQKLGIPHVATLHIDYEPREHAGFDGLIAVASWQRARIGPEFRGETAVIWNWLPAAMRRRPRPHHAGGARGAARRLARRSRHHGDRQHRPPDAGERHGPAGARVSPGISARRRAGARS